MKIAFIGGGNMAAAMVSGILKAKLLLPKNICVSDPNPSDFFVTGRIVMAENNQAAVDFADFIFLTVKPQLYAAVLENLTRTKGKVFITVAPGITMEYVAAKTDGAKVIRTMPNTPALIGQGATAVCRGSNVTSDEFQFVKRLFKSFSSVFDFEESQMDDVVSLSGSGPAYAYMMIEAMADFGAAKGIERNIAAKMAAQTLLGAAAMVLQSGESPEVLRQRVCSKGGTTIKAVEELNNCDFTGAIRSAMQACTERAKELKSLYCGEPAT